MPSGSAHREVNRRRYNLGPVESNVRGRVEAPMPVIGDESVIG